MRVLLTVLAIAVVAVAYAHLGAADPASESEGIPDSHLGLAKNHVKETPTPVRARPNATEPGESKAVGPVFEGAPPLIPHLVSDFLPITADSNMCRECHDMPGASGQTMEDGEPIPMPRSHYTDLRRSPDKPGTSMVGARYVCSQCHVAQTDAKPLVMNTYGK